jgi:acyl-coenzyme A thioesterase PaaI-like protein
VTRAGAGNGGRGRLAAIVLLAAALAGGALAATVPAPRAPRTALQPSGLAAEAAPVGSASSIWYCPGGPENGGVTTQLLLANAAGRAVRVDVVVTDARGAQGRRTFRLGPHSVTVAAPGSLVHGAWLASRVEVAGGAVSATELVDGRSGRAVAQCASGASMHWYFASGSTQVGSTLDVAVSNPTRALAVVDLTFVTASGFTAPAPFQGLVIEPGMLRVMTVGAYVQNQGSVMTVVAARSGAVVAGELQSYGPGGVGGVALTLGAPAASPRWVLPSVEDAAGGASELTMFNPSGHRESVVVDVRLPTGPVQPFTQKLGPQSVWTLTTSDQFRIATQEPYTVEVHATGPGVVVARSGSGAPHGPAPWWAGDVAVSWLEASAAHQWMVAGTADSARVAALSAAAPPAVAQTPAARSLAALASTSTKLVLQNPSRRTVRAEVTWWPASGTSSGTLHVRNLHLPAMSHAALTLPIGLAVVRADGPIEVMGDASPPGVAGVIGIPAVPLR